MKGFTKRFMAFLLCFCLMLSAAPLSSFAVDDGTGTAAEETEVSVTAEPTENAGTEEDEPEEPAAEEPVAEETPTEEEAQAEEPDASPAEESDGQTDEPTLTLTAVAEETEDGEETTVSMPAATLKQTDADTGVAVTVEAPEGAFPEGVTMTVETVDGADAEAFLTAVAEDLALTGDTYTVIDAAILDISFYADGAETQPTTDVTVTISGLTLATDGAEYALVYHMDDEGNAEYVEAEEGEQVGKDAYTFTASSFSEYGVVNVAVEYGISVAATLTSSSTTISYTYGSNNNNSAAANITVHFVDSDGNELSNATISYESVPSYTTRNSTVTLSDLAGYYTVTVDGTTYSYMSGYSKIATSSSTSYSAATTAEYFRYNKQGNSNNYRWQYSTNGNSYTSLSSAITDIYLVYGDSSNITWNKNNTSINKGTADHIDIEVDTTATIVIDGVTYTASITLTKSDFENNVTVTARWNGQTFTDFTVDDSNITTSSSSTNKSQYRVGGSYPVGTKDNPVEYQFTLRKTVTFTNESGGTFDVTMDFVSDWFSYWQTTNNCPGLSNSTTSWQNGNFITGSGLDFTLSASAEAVTILVYKYIVDESGNQLDVDSAVTYSFTVYEDLDEDMEIDTSSDAAGVVNTDTFTVAVGSSSDTYSTQVDPGYYCVIEDTDSLANSTITVSGKEYTYSYTYTRSTGVLESTGTTGTKETTNGITGVLKADASTTAVFNIYNVYKSDDTGSLTLTKTVKADSSITTTGMEFTFYVSGFDTAVTSVTDSDGNTYTVSNSVATVTVPADSSVTLVDIPVGSYTVYETDGTADTTVTANNYTWTISGDEDKSVTVTKGGTASATITNTVTGTATLYITKNWVDASNKWGTRPANDGSSFSVTLTATGTNGESYTYTTDADWSESTNTWTLDLSGVTVYDTEGKMLTYSIAETTLDDYTLDKVTVSGSGIDKTDYVEEAMQGKIITPAEGQVNITLQNSLNTANVTVTKTLKDSSGDEITDSTVNDDDFTMQLYTYNEKTGTYTEVAAHTLTLSDVMTYTFSDLPLGTYYLKEVLAGTNDHAYTVTVTGATANDDGYYVITLTEADATVEVSVTNQEQEIDITDSTLTFPAVTKTYTSNNISSSTDTTFTFYIMDTSGYTVATGTATTSIGATNPASVSWTYTEGAFTYTEVGTYVYTIREYNSGAAGVKYDDTVYTLVVTVSTDSDGKLTSSYEIYTTYNGEGATGNVAVSGKTASFTNTYSPSEINFFMIVRKVLTGRTIKEGEFSVTLQEYKYENGTFTTEGSAITVTNGADSTFSHTFTYGSEGTYYYKAKEVDSGETGTTYDSKTSWIKVVVGSEDNVLKVTSVEWVQFDTDTEPTAETTWTQYSGTLSDYVAFQNTYTATGTATLTAYKPLTGRDLNAGEFTFLLVALDSTAPMPSEAVTAATGDDYVTKGYVVAGEKYVIATNADDGSISFGSITYTEDDIGKTYTYRVEEVVGTLNGVTYDTVDSGKLIYVTIADGGNSTLTVTVTTSGTEDKNGDNVNDVVIYNTFSQGSTTIYGTKVWVDGDKSHNNSDEVKLTLYYSTDGGTN